MTERNPHTAPAPGDRWRDEITGSVREVCDVRTRANGKKGPLLVYYWVARQWEGKKNYVKRPGLNKETGKEEMVSVFVGQDTAKTPPRWKRVSLARFTAWSVRPGVKFLGTSTKGTPKPGRVTFDMLPAHQAFPKKAAAK